MITVGKELHAVACFLPMSREGKELWCRNPQCSKQGLIATFLVDYVTVIETRKTSNRHHTRGNKRGRHQGEIAN